MARSGGAGRANFASGLASVDKDCASAAAELELLFASDFESGCGEAAFEPEDCESILKFPASRRVRDWCSIAAPVLSISLPETTSVFEAPETAFRADSLGSRLLWFRASPRGAAWLSCDLRRLRPPPRLRRRLPDVVVVSCVLF